MPQLKQEVLDGIKHGVIGAVIGIIVIMVGGHMWPGWVLKSTAQQMASEASRDAVVTVLANQCALKFNAAPNKAAAIVEARNIDYWRRGTYLLERGYVPKTGKDDVDSLAGDGCANILQVTIDAK